MWSCQKEEGGREIEGSGSGDKGVSSFYRRLLFQEWLLEIN